MKKKSASSSRKYMIKVGLPAVILGLITVIIMVNTAWGRADSQDRSLLSINQTGIPQEEFTMFLQDEKANMADYFFKTYGAEYDQHFWITSFDGEIPIELAKEKALKKLVEVKVQQQVATQYDVLQSAAFDHIQSEMNQSQSMYGSDSLDLYQSYMIHHSKVLLDTKSKYKLKAEPVSEEDSRQFYEAKRQEKFKEPDELQALIIRYVNSDEDSITEAVRGWGQQILDRYQDGEITEDSLSQHSSPSILNMDLVRYGSGEGKDEHSSERESLLKDQAYLLSPGQISDPVQYGNDRYILVSLERKLGRIANYEEVKVTIDDLLLEERFEMMMQETVNKAVTEIQDQQEYDQLTMQ